MHFFKKAPGGLARRAAVILFLMLIAPVDKALEAAQLRTIRVGFFPNITHGQALYAKATGEFEKQTETSIQWTSFNGGPSAIEAMFTDAIDATYIGPSPTINGYLKSRGEKFVVVAGAASGGTGLVVRKDAGITGEKDFSGKIVATPQLGNTQDIAARVWFAEKGYKLKEKGGTVTLLPLANPDQLTLFQKNEIHGAWTVEPWLARLELEGNGKLLIDEKTLWPEGRYVTTHLILSKDFLSQHPQLARKLIAAHVDVTQKLSADKNASSQVINQQLQKETGKALPAEVVKKAMERVEFTFDPIAPSLRKSAESAHKIGFIKNSPQLDGLYSLRLLNEVLKEKNLPPIQE